jgi:predicted dinucleotide-binding enzyme
MVQVAIVGTGDQSYGIAHLFSNSNCGFSGNSLEVTKPSVHHTQVFHDTGVAVVTMENALANADIVILAIPSNQLSGFVYEHLKILRNKILVDVTNSYRPHEDLQSVLGICDHQISWVKAFNDIGAVDVLLDKPTYKSKRTTKMCAADQDALKVVKAFAEESLGLRVKVVPYERYNDIAMSQNSLGKEWIHATYILLFVFAYSEFYAVLRYNVFKGYEWYHLPIQVTNKGICWTSLTGMALAQLPGVLARAYDSYAGNNLISKPRALVWSLGLRKHVGVLSLWFLVLHIIMSLLLMNEKYYGKFFDDPTLPASKMNGIGEHSFFFATMGTGLYIIMGLCSINSIGSQMTNLQWQVVYGPVAWIALMFGTIHVLIMGVKGWPLTHKWPGGLPPITMTSVLVPLFVIFLKLLQKIYCSFNSVNSNHNNGNVRQYRTSVTKSLIDGDARSRFEDDNSNSSLANF